MTITEHPADETLQSYGLGKLEAAASTYVEHHLTVCEDCRRRAAEVSGDGFVKRMEKAAGSDATGSYMAQSAAMPAVAVPQPAANVPPELAALSEYTDVRELGRGGMGVVYLARHSLSDREEVLKVVNKALLAADGGLDRFMREIRAACALDHPNIVTAYGAQQVGEALILRLAYVPGHDLSKYVKQHGPLSVARACYYVHQAAQGLQYAHDQKMIHRDIKPANLMLMQQGKKHIVKVLDFGLAKSTVGAEPNPGLTGSGHAIGTPDYMAPEQFKDATSVDGRADVYALGCTLYYLLSGRAPFRGVSVVDLFLAHANTAPESLSDTRQDVPAALDAVLGKMMAKAPADRFQTPGELAKALMPFVKPTAKPAAAELLATQANEETGAQRATIAGADRLTKPTRGGARKWVLATVGVLVLAVSGVLGAYAAGVFVKTSDGTIELTDLAPDADVFVDGQKVTVTWADGKTSAEVRVKPGTYQVEVKKDGFVAIGEQVMVSDGESRMVTAKLVRVPKKEERKPPPEFNPIQGTALRAYANSYNSARFIPISLADAQADLRRKGKSVKEDNTGVDGNDGPAWNVTSDGWWSATAADTGRGFPFGPIGSDFHAKLEVRLGQKTTAGFMFRRGRRPIPPDGKSIQLSSHYVVLDTTDPMNTGRLHRWQADKGIQEKVAEAFTPAFAADVPHLLEVVARDKQVAAWLDGQLVCTWTDTGTDSRLALRDGRFAVRLESGQMAFRNVEIKHLGQDRLFQTGSVWKGHMEHSVGTPGRFSTTLTVVERRGDNATIQVENNFHGFKVNAQVVGGTLSWDIKEAKFFKGRHGNSPSGTIDGNAIRLKFDGVFTSGTRNVGVIELMLSDR